MIQCIPKYFICFRHVGNGLIFLKYFSDELFLVNNNITFFSMLTSYFTVLLNWLIGSNSLLLVSVKFSRCKIYHLQSGFNFAFPISEAIAICGFITCRYVPSIPNLFRIFLVNECWFPFNFFFCLLRLITLVSILRLMHIYVFIIYLYICYNLCMLSYACISGLNFICSW